MKQNWTFKSLYILLFAIYSNAVIAQSEFNTESGNLIKLSLKTEVGHEDNFLFSNTNELATSYFILMPKIEVQAQFERQLFSVEAISQHRKYQDFAKDDHSNFTLSPRYQYRLAENKGLFINTTLKNIYQRRGTGLSLGNGASISKGDELKTTDVSGGYIFGTKESVTKFKIEVGSYESSYQTRRDITYLLDRKNNYADITLDYLLSGQTYIASNIGYEKITSNYNSLLDNEKYIALIGIKWQATEISQFDLLLGYQEIKFDESTFTDDSAFKWRLNYNWHPLYFTKISLRTERDFKEANRLSNSYRVVDNYDIEIKSSFTDFFEAVAVIGINQEEIVYQHTTEKEDYIFSNLTLNYKQNEWLSFYIQYDYSDLDSTEFEYNYQRNSISMGFNVSM